ncbi:MAG: bacterial proteasome activator family protein [Desertimonas sp.]
MTDASIPTPDDSSATGGAPAAGSERGQLVTSDEQAAVPQDSVTQPAKVMRIGSMVKSLLEEVRSAPLDEASRERLAEIFERSVVELAEALSPDLQEELRMLALPFRDDEIPSESEIRVAKAQLVGWLEGLFHGIQATLMAQQVAARQQLEQIRQLPQGVQPGQMPGMPGVPQQAGVPTGERPGTYL